MESTTLIVTVEPSVDTWSALVANARGGYEAWVECSQLVLRHVLPDASMFGYWCICGTRVRHGADSSVSFVRVAECAVVGRMGAWRRSHCG